MTIPVFMNEIYFSDRYSSFQIKIKIIPTDKKQFFCISNTLSSLAKKLKYYRRK
jgi:hypothetical protein